MNLTPSNELTLLRLTTESLITPQDAGRLRIRGGRGVTFRPAGTVVWDSPGPISDIRGPGLHVLFPSPNRTSESGQLLVSALLTGSGAALGPKFSAHPDEPGAGDSISLRERLEKCPESHLPVWSLPV